ncbi:MAG: hypothetical protein HFE98_03700 [Ruminiclostridium sp.]|jgi:hypothetical protein|nr:hypothetical protein [Ruminiclostridium sp.]MCI9466659.1 hypothetical protein [Ruminiclostridium sp.]
MRNLRNIIIAVLLLIFLLVTPFWGSIKEALGLADTDGETGATPETAGCLVEKT